MTMKEFKQLPIWLCWRYETKRGQRTKVPYGVDGKPIGTNIKYEKRWVIYFEAIKSVKLYNYDGVGYVIPKGYCGIDLDNREVSDSLSAEIGARFNTYSEFSPSGTGQHLLLKCDISKIPQTDGKLDSRHYSKNPHNQLEIYFGGLTNRFFTYTGNIINNVPIEDGTDTVLWFLETHMLKSKFKTPKEQKSDEYDPIATAKKSKCGNKFISLYDDGDISEYGSHSEADLALCNYLAFFTGGSETEIDRLFRQSKLYREKWEREDYRSTTIQNSIDSCGGRFYRPMPPYLYSSEKGGLSVIRPLLAKYIRENLRYLFVRDTIKGGLLRYVYEDSGIYKLYFDDMFKGIIKKYISDFDESAVRMSDVEEVFRQLNTDLKYVDTTTLNSDEGVINFTNGILHLETMTLLPHNPDHHSTIQIPCEWTECHTPTPIFDKFMNDLTEGSKEVEKLLLQFMGVCLSNVKGWRLKKALFLVGKGDTGKSQLRSLVERLIGKGNYAGIDLRELEARFGTSNIYMKRLAGSADMSYVALREIKTFKKITGGDSLFAEFKGKDGFEFVYEGLIWYCMNRFPKFGGDNGKWVYDRIMVVECNNVIPHEKQDKLLQDKLYAERDGIVYKAVMALRRVIANGYAFDEPASVIAARNKYRMENNTVITFFEECMEKRPNGKLRDDCTTSKVYAVYKAWCFNNNNGYAKTAKEFRDEFADFLKIDHQNIIVRRGSIGTLYRDYTLTDEAKKQYYKAYGGDGFIDFSPAKELPDMDLPDDE